MLSSLILRRHYIHRTFFIIYILLHVSPYFCDNLPPPAISSLSIFYRQQHVLYIGRAARIYRAACLPPLPRARQTAARLYISPYAYLPPRSSRCAAHNAAPPPFFYSISILSSSPYRAARSCRRHILFFFFSKHEDLFLISSCARHISMYISHIWKWTISTPAHIYPSVFLLYI